LGSFREDEDEEEYPYFWTNQYKYWENEKMVRSMQDVMDGRLRDGIRGPVMFGF